ncbi:MAG: CoA ester lyase [Sporomusaceae bacterium]|nr:CoA ester lyase [Sporomusaceae bacterium]
MLRRTLLFIPGSNPNMLQNAGILGSDTVILDLEDAVAPTEKDAARFLTANALKRVKFGHTEVVVRINPLETYAKEDLPVIVPAAPDAILLPKVQEARDIELVSQELSRLEQEHQLNKEISLFALIETPLGLSNALAIAKANPRVKALALGAEDFTAGINATRTKAGAEIAYARAALVTAAYAAGVQAIDTPFTDVNDEPGLIADTMLAKQMGFTAKLAINPRQVAAIQAVFTPSQQEIIWAQRVVEALEAGKARGLGAVSLDNKMIDLPIMLRATRLLDIAKSARLI